MIEIRWHGRGGQGSFTVARLLGASAALYEDKYALSFPSFGPERRGAPVLGFTKIHEKKINDRSEVKTCDYVVLLDETLINENVVKGLKENGTIIINSKNPGRYDILKGFNVVAIDATSIALDILKRPITNTAMLGALIAVSDVVKLESAVKGIESEMKKSIVNKNIEVLKKAYETVKGVK
ncbi:MAG: pyruvate ferredoxin oxidoreductase [Firmicutes bacterium]|nr:pyruvate ferredoxin oxidoreductase [Bacillota bacterium]MTI69447.1 pyruvate ferredoxin oxidoreductase [Bacillota bacterium]